MVVVSLLTMAPAAGELAPGGLAALFLLAFLILLALLAGLAILYLTSVLQAETSPSSLED